MSLDGFKQSFSESYLGKIGNLEVSVLMSDCSTSAKRADAEMNEENNNNLDPCVKRNKEKKSYHHQKGPMKLE